MTLIVADRVKDTTNTTGSGTITLNAAPAAGYQAFSAVMAINDTCWYTIEGGAEWEVGLGTLTTATTLARTTVFASSNANAAVVFSAGTKNVFLTMPATRLQSIANNVRGTVTVTTASLANLASESSTVTLGQSYRVLSVQVDRACRVRLYTTTAARAADASRAIGTDPTGDHGCMLDLAYTAPGTLTMSPLVDGFLPTGTAVPYLIENRSGATSTVQVIFTYIVTES